MSDSNWMVYGANGYTGQLVAEETVARGMRPVLAGRREEAVRPLAERLGCEHRVFDLDSGEEVARQLEGVGMVLLCAGPFSRTSRPVVDACLSLGIHYLDITGEIPVFEACHARTSEAERAGSILLPGVGFDVVPSDCLTSALAARLPDATELVLGIRAIGSSSAGTTRTALEIFARGGAVRRDGRIVKVPLAAKRRQIPFHDEPRVAALVPWGDVATAYHSTGIGNVEVYLALPPRLIRALKVARYLGRVFQIQPVKKAASRWIDKRVAGPSAEQRASGRCELWGSVKNQRGDEVQGTLTTPEAYRFTVLAAVAAAQQVLAGGIEPRAHTPSTAFGAEFVTHIADCTLRVPDHTAAASSASASR
jgi:short subunit dehydrogenase-like uncharacterized protein